MYLLFLFFGRKKEVYCGRSELTMETEEILLLLHAAGHLHDGDGEAVGGGSKHRRGQRHVVLIQELYRV